jgi:hypothetical protein
MGQTVEDLKIRYRVIPAGSEIGAPSLRVADARGSVLYDGPIVLGPEGSGEVMVPKGQAVKPTPNSITIEVRNPDGQVSAPVAGGGALLLRPPVLNDLSKSRVVVGGTSFELVLRGRNFASGAEVGFGIADADPTYQSAQVISDKSFGQPCRRRCIGSVGTVGVTVRAAGLVSNELPILVVPAGLPPGPSLQSIAPGQVIAGADDFWLTLTGNDFNPPTVWSS